MPKEEQIQDIAFSCISLAQLVPADHPLRGIRKLTDGLLGSLSPALDKL
jgi:hypothetical protein